MGEVALHGPDPRLYSPPHDDLLSEDLTRGPGKVPRPEDGGPQASERHSHRAGQTEEGPEGRPLQHPRHPSGPAGVRPDRQGLRHAPSRSQVRPREDEPDPQPVPDLSVEDDWRPLRASAHRARLAPPPLSRPTLSAVSTAA